MTISVRQEDFDSIADEWECILPHNRRQHHLHHTRGGSSFGGGATETRTPASKYIQCATAIRYWASRPLMVKGDTLSFLGDTDLFDYHDLLVREGCEDDFYAAIWQRIEAMDWRAMELKSLRDSSETLRRFPRVGGG